MLYMYQDRQWAGADVHGLAIQRRRESIVRPQSVGAITRREVLAILLLSVSALAADDGSLSSNKALIRNSAHRIIQLADGSELLLYSASEMPHERNPIFGFLSSARGMEFDRPLRLWQWIPNELAEGTAGQIYGGASSPDGKRLAITGGWLGKNDHRGHNGVFVLEWVDSGNMRDYWRVRSWFDVKGATVGDVAFGPNDTILVTWHKETSDATAPTLAAFSWTGQKLGEFFPNAAHVDAYDGATDTRYSRIVGTADGSYVMYDSAAQAVRYFDLHAADQRIAATELKSVPVKFGRTANFCTFRVQSNGVDFTKRSLSDRGPIDTRLTLRRDGIVEQSPAGQ